MTLRAFIQVLAWLWVTVAVTLSTLQAQAQNACGKLHLRASVYESSFKPLQSYVRASHALTMKLRGNLENGNLSAKTFDSKKLKEDIAQVQAAAEVYLNEGGFSFEKVTTTASLKFADGSQRSFNYKVFLLRGSRSGDEFSRMIYGAEIHPESQMTPPQFILDTLYEINNNSGAHFLAGTKTIAFGYRALESSTVGHGSEVRHEIQHYFEEMAMLRGEMTLARIGLEKGKKDDKDIYSEEFVLDELEAHLRDVRMISNKNRTQAIDEKLEQFYRDEPEKLTQIRTSRETIRKDKQEYLNKLILSAEEAVQKLRLELQEGRYKIAEDHVTFHIPEARYREVTFALTGLSVRGKKQARTAIEQILNWSEKRIQEVRTEFAELQKE